MKTSQIIVALGLVIASFVTQVQAKSIKKIHNPKDLSVEKSESWKFTISYYTETSQCTGVFVSHRKILTAKHCFEDSNKVTDIFFFKGSDYYHSKSLSSGDYRIRKHYSMDLAVIELNDFIILHDQYLADDYRPVTTVSSSHFQYFDSGLRNRNLYITGAGTNNKGRSFYLGFGTGRYTYQSYGKYEIKMLRNQGGCAGDSGAPVTFSHHSDGLVLVGIHVSGLRDINSKCGKRVYFEAISASVSDWIYEY
jgi:V8-like Glu-specific endopeptidase